jgi:hypothetical protein
MNLLLIEFVSFILPFATLFSKRTWHSGLVLLVGAILAPGKRTISAALRVMGLSQERHFLLLPNGLYGRQKRFNSCPFLIREVTVVVRLIHRLKSI